MMKFMIDMMWFYCRLMGDICTTIGLAGLMGFGIIGLMKITDKILEEATEGNE